MTNTDRGTGLLPPAEREKFAEEFIRECERRAGVSKEEMLKHLRLSGAHAKPDLELCPLAEWLRAILGGRP